VAGYYFGLQGGSPVKRQKVGRQWIREKLWNIEERANKGLSPGVRTELIANVH